MVGYGILVARYGAGPSLETDVQKILLANVRRPSTARLPAVVDVTANAPRLPT